MPPSFVYPGGYCELRRGHIAPLRPTGLPASVRAKLARLTALPASRIESVQISRCGLRPRGSSAHDLPSRGSGFPAWRRRYERGGGATDHYDDDPCAEQLGAARAAELGLRGASCGLAGRRLVTVLIYLRTLGPADGGATYFVDRRLRVRPERGKVRMCLAYGLPTGRISDGLEL